MFEDSPVIPMADVVEPVPDMRIEMGDGYLFTVEEVHVFLVDDSIPAKQMVTRGGHQLGNWSWLGKKKGFWLLAEKRTGKRTVKAAIGRLSLSWTDDIVVNLLKKPGCRFKGSGAWVREGFLVARPQYHRRCWLGFPADPASRWQATETGFIVFPDLKYNGDKWSRGFCSVGDETSACGLLCLLWEETGAA